MEDSIDRSLHTMSMYEYVPDVRAVLDTGRVGLRWPRQGRRPA